VVRFNVVNDHSTLACRFSIDYPDLATPPLAQSPVVWSGTGELLTIEATHGTAFSYDLQVDNFRASLYRSALKKKGCDYERIPSTPAEVWHAGTQ
jgi:hypothetical protein